MVKVSVLMPVYKTDEKYLREAIESILNQTFTDFEFLILDDCPEDDREYIIKSYKDERIVYAKNEKNLGITPTRNKLINMAKGEYLAVFDHDDISLPERLAKQVEYLDNYLDVGVVGCKVQYMNSKKQSGKITEDRDIKRALMHNCAIMHPASMIRKSVLKDNNISYEEKYTPSEDYALWCRLIKYTNFHNLKDILFLYRGGKGNTSNLQKDKMAKATIEIRAFVQTENKVLLEEFKQTATHISRYKLFGVIPLITVKSKGNKISIHLFEVIPLLKIRNSIKI